MNRNLEKGDSFLKKNGQLQYDNPCRRVWSAMEDVRKQSLDKKSIRAERYEKNRNRWCQGDWTFGLWSCSQSTRLSTGNVRPFAERGQNEEKGFLNHWRSLKMATSMVVVEIAFMLVKSESSFTRTRFNKVEQDFHAPHWNPQLACSLTSWTE